MKDDNAIEGSKGDRDLLIHVDGSRGVKFEMLNSVDVPGTGWCALAAEGLAGFARYVPCVPFVAAAAFD